MQKQKTLDGGETEDLDCRVRNSAFYLFYVREYNKVLPWESLFVRSFGKRPETETKLTDYGIEV